MVKVVVLFLHLLCIWAFDMGAFLFLLCVSLHITTIPHGSGRQADRKAARARMESWKLLLGFFAFNWGAPGRWEKGGREGGGGGQVGSQSHPTPCGRVLMVRFQESFLFVFVPCTDRFQVLVGC